MEGYLLVLLYLCKKFCIIVEVVHLVTYKQKLHVYSVNKLRGVLFIVRAANNINKADFMHIRRTTFPNKMKIGVYLEELK